MKGVCLLLCIMLARDIAGSIFRPRFDPRMANLVVQPLELQRNQRTNEHHQQNRHNDHHQRNRPASSETPVYQTEDSNERIPVDDSTSDYYRSKGLINAWNSAFYSTVIGQGDDQQTYDDVTTWMGQQEAKIPTAVTNEKDYTRSSIFYDALITMKHMTEEEKKRFHEAYKTAVQTSNEDVNLSAPQLLKKHHYRVEEHTVKTDDGYILTLFRIPAKKDHTKEDSQEHSRKPSWEENKEESKEHNKDKSKEHNSEDESKINSRENSKEHSREHSREQNKEQSREESNEHSKESSTDVRKAPVVFLMHGLLGSADDWLLMGPGKSLAYLLADAGYDVWLGNARGNKYSRRHVSKHPAQPDFWQFSTDEIALHDLPAMIDYTLNKTKQHQLVYVGHSQGNTALFALTSTRPEYNDKIKMMYAISPMVYVHNARSPFLRMVAANYRIQDGLKDDLLGQGEFNPNKILVELAGGNMCEYEIGCKDVCSNVHFVMAGVNPEDVEVSRIPVIMAHLPAGTSVRQVKQYGQAAATHEFRKYDYGVDINKKIYGQREPPQYDMSQVKVPVALYYSERDWFAHPKDVERLRQELPNVQDAYEVPDEHFTHTDFQFSKKAPEIVYKRLIKSMKTNQQ